MTEIGSHDRTYTENTIAKYWSPTKTLTNNQTNKNKKLCEILVLPVSKVRLSITVTINFQNAYYNLTWNKLSYL